VPPAPEEKEIRAKLAKIGIGSDKPFDFKSLSTEQKEAFMLGMKAGDEKVDKFLASGVKNVNGWNIGSFFGDRAFFNGDWLKRAADKSERTRRTQQSTRAAARNNSG
jgi:hypothetical protein